MYQVPLATHMAETQAELQLIRHRTGHFIDFLRDLGIANLDGLAKKLTLNLRPFRGVPHGLLIHCNYLALKIPIPPSASIVYCPRTHAAFGHPPHPFRDFLVRGIRVALGTDSLASNPDLDILAEARFIHERYPDVPGEIILRMLTLSGAEALGWADETGSLTPGKSADLVVLPLPDRDDEPERLVLESSAAVRSVLFRGEWTVGNAFCY
jgi:cytosine/adenosine deaminase-related metal-dependent hydrolase